MHRAKQILMIVNLLDKQMKSFFSFLCVALFAFGAHADEVAPDVLIRTVTDDVLTIVRTDKDLKSGNTAKAVDLVEAKVAIVSTGVERVETVLLEDELRGIVDLDKVREAAGK